MGFFGACIILFYCVLAWASVRGSNNTYATGFVYGGMAVGFFVSYWAIFNMVFSGTTEALSVAQTDELFDKAMYVAVHTRSSVYLKKYPLTFFKKHGFSETDVNYACHIDSPPTVTFHLEKTYWLGEKYEPCYLSVRSKDFPLEIAPEWLRKTSDFKEQVARVQKLVTERIEEAKAKEEARRKAMPVEDISCDEKVLEILKAAGSVES